jgi:HPt (histidine-containing phosphotransfer) domain-containing protein
MCLFEQSLDPLLALLDEHRARGSSVGIKFEAHKLSSAAAQMGALKLAAACREITRHFASGEFRAAPSKLDLLVDDVITEIIRVQRKLHHLQTLATGSH